MFFYLFFSPDVFLGFSHSSVALNLIILYFTCVKGFEKNGVLCSCPSFKPPPSLMCALLIHFNSCECRLIFVFVRTPNIWTCALSHGNGSVCRGLCHKKYTKKTAIKRPPAPVLLISHLHQPLSCVCLYQRR